MTQGDIDAGIVRLVVGFAPLKPAEFVVVQIKQIVGQTAVQHHRGVGVGVDQARQDHGATRIDRILRPVARGDRRR